MLSEVGLGLAAVVGALYLMQTFPNRDPQNPMAHAKATQIMIYAASAFAWPCLLIVVAQKEWQAGTFARSPIMWLVSMWVLLVFGVDIFMLDRTPSQRIETANKRKNEALSTTNIILGAVFTFGVLLSSIKENEKRSSRSARIILISLLIAVLFVLPVFEVDNNDNLALAVASVVKVACVYSVGLFIVGVGVELT